MVRLGLFFPFLTDCWYPSRKPKWKKNHLWLHCPPLSLQVQTCSVWQQPRVGCSQRLVGAGFSIPMRCHMPVLVTASFSAGGDLPLPADTWVIDAGAWVSEEHTPTNHLREPSVFNDLSGGVGFIPPARSRQENFQYCAWSFTFQIC